MILLERSIKNNLADTLSYRIDYGLLYVTTNCAVLSSTYNNRLYPATAIKERHIRFKRLLRQDEPIERPKSCRLYIYNVKNVLQTAQTRFLFFSFYNQAYRKQRRKYGDVTKISHKLIWHSPQQINKGKPIQPRQAIEPRS